jgi:hypothetical protein
MLDIGCYDEVRYFAPSRQHTCRARYVDVATSKAGREFTAAVQMHCNMLNPLPMGAVPGVLQGCDPVELVNASASAQPMAGCIQLMNERLDAEMQRLERESPELAEAIAAYDVKLASTRTRAKPNRQRSERLA